MKGRHLFASAHGDEQSDAGRYASGRPPLQRPYREPVCADADQTRLARDKLPKKSFKANGRRRASPSRALPRQGNPTRETLLAVLPAAGQCLAVTHRHEPPA
ncbi:MAG: hypothetical protein V5B38_23985 [Candidatus Accumulibacter propinquus]|jgi:hypothetical protein